MTRSYQLVTLLGITMLGATLVSNGPAQTTTASPKQPDRIALADENARQMMMLMDTDKNGRISKQEWIDFMSAEFDRLDTDKSGYLDLKELQKSNLTVRHVPTAVQGK